MRTETMRGRYLSMVFTMACLSFPILLLGCGNSSYTLGGGGENSGDRESEREQVLGTPELVNRPPTLSVPSNSFYAEIGRVLYFDLTADDLDPDDTLVVTGTGTPDGATLVPVDRKTWRFAWTPPTAGGVGSPVDLRFTVSDGKGGSAEVGPIRLVPFQFHIQDPGSKLFNENQVLEFVLTVDDPLSRVISFPADRQKMPTGATFDGTTGTFHWQPTFSQAGAYVAQFYVETDEAVPSSAEISVPITVLNVNRAPTIGVPQASYVLPLGTDLSVTISGDDPDVDDALVFSWSLLPVGSSMQPQGPRGLRFFWRPTSGQEGTYSIVVDVSDGKGGTDSKSFGVDVVSCVDGRKDGTETDVDCGGSCMACLDGKRCAADSDCLSNVCASGVCIPNSGGEKCLPLVPGHNDVNADRINLVFVGVEYGVVASLVSDARKAIDLLHQYGVGQSLSELAIYQNNMDKINLWYVNEVVDLPWDLSGCTFNTCNCDLGSNGLGSLCNLPNKVVANFTNFRCRSYGYFPYNGSYGESFTDPQDRMPFMFGHELQHQFVGLRDEYIYSPSSWNYYGFNCVTTRQKAEASWGDLIARNPPIADACRTVGYFSGCSNSYTSIRPTLDSMMNNSNNYCLGPVNERFIQQEFGKYSGSASAVGGGGGPGPDDLVPVAMLEIAKDRIVHASVQMVKRMAVKDRGSPSSQMDLDLEVTLVLNDATEVVHSFSSLQEYAAEYVGEGDGFKRAEHGFVERDEFKVMIPLSGSSDSAEGGKTTFVSKSAIALEQVEFRKAGKIVDRLRPAN